MFFIYTLKTRKYLDFNDWVEAINKFNLENRYPRLAKLINLRRTLQAYYLRISFIWIFLAVIPQLVVYIMILEPRLGKIFNIFM